MWAFSCEQSVNGVDRLLSILPWQYHHLFSDDAKPENSPSEFNANCAWQTNVPESAVNNEHWTAQLKNLCFPEVKLLTNKCTLQWQTKIMKSRLVLTGHHTHRTCSTIRANFYMSWSIRNFFNLSSDQKTVCFREFQGHSTVHITHAAKLEICILSRLSVFIA